MGDSRFQKKQEPEKDAFQKFSDGIRNAPDAIFDFGEDKDKYAFS